MRNYLKMFMILVGVVTVISLPVFSSAAVKAAPAQVPQVELYVTSWCPYCTKAKAFFEQRGIAYQLYDVERDPAAAKRKQQLDTGRGVPFAIINGTKISGWSQQAYQAALEN